VFKAILYYGDNYILVNEKTGKFYEASELPKHPAFPDIPKKELDKQFVLNFYKFRQASKADPLWDWERQECEQILTN
jgi:hypothetical protein